MLKGGLEAKSQIKKWIEHQTYLPSFTAEDWIWLQQVESVLAKFEEFTLIVSKQRPQISLAIPIYYELQDLLNDAVTMQGEFAELDTDIAQAVSAGMAKYKKYYDFMDAQDAYYVALVLNPRFKTLLLEKELDKEAASAVIQGIKELLYKHYPLQAERQSSVSKELEINTRQSIEARVLQKLQPQRKQRSDIDRYFEDDIVAVSETATKDKNWLFTWWRLHKEEFPCMAAAARDYLAIPASEVAVERLFNRGRDLLGLRRHSLNAETIRRLMLLRDMYISKEANF
jgi:hypothetical protein